MLHQPIGYDALVVPRVRDVAHGTDDRLQRIGIQSVRWLFGPMAISSPFRIFEHLNLGFIPECLGEMRGGRPGWRRRGDGCFLFALRQAWVPFALRQELVRNDLLVCTTCEQEGDDEKIVHVCQTE